MEKHATDYGDFLSYEFKPDPNGGDNGTTPRLIKTSAEFVADFTPPEYVIDGILQRRFCYAFTAKTGGGKTAIMLMTAAHVALGRAIGNRDVEQGPVLYFAGENPDDVRMRWIAMADEIGFDINTIGVHFIPGTFKISEMRDRIIAEIKALGCEFTLVMIDTSAAYFEGDDENNNKQAGEHARRLRSLTQLPGGPCVLIACHPVKNAADDNLLPRGGGAFTNEVDGNLTARKNDSAVEVHWQSKFRGPDFAPISFQLRTVTHPKLKDSKGRLLPTVLASHLSEEGEQEMASAARFRENALLDVLAKHGNASQADLARRLNWIMRDGAPYKKLVSRTLESLRKAKLIKGNSEGGFDVTTAGRKRSDNGDASTAEGEGERPANGEPPANPGMHIVGPAKPGTFCERCHRAEGDVLRIRSKAGSKAYALHQSCAEKRFQNTENA